MIDKSLRLFWKKVIQQAIIDSEQDRTIARIRRDILFFKRNPKSKYTENMRTLVGVTNKLNVALTLRNEARTWLESADFKIACYFAGISARKTLANIKKRRRLNAKRFNRYSC